jgi:hypothetical protein
MGTNRASSGHKMELMDPPLPGHRIVIGPPQLPPLVWLGVVMATLMVPIAVGSLLAGGSPAVLLGFVAPIIVGMDLRRLRRIRLTVWEHRLVFDNGKGSLALDRDAIAGFEVAVPASTVIAEEGPSFKTWTWGRPLVEAVRHDGRRVPLFATQRRQGDATLAAHLSCLENWLRRPS